MKLNNETYDLLKFISIYVIPSVETFWLTIATAWNLPYAQPIGITIGAVGMLIAGCIGLSVREYERAKAEEHEGAE
jgi:hypothetical protein